MIRRDGAGRYCLNDLHRASGGESRHQPAFWMRNAQTRALIQEIGNSADLQSSPVASVEGAGGGTYVTELLVIAYAAWISPASYAAAVRVITRDGEPWFVAADVCAALALDNVTRAIERLDEDERTLITVQGASNGLPVNAVNEPGLYSLILTSRKPEAKRFKKWVTSEVLPAIRKTGAYSIAAAPAQLAAPQTMSEALRLAIGKPHRRRVGQAEPWPG